MSRDMWLSKREVQKIDKIKKSLTLPSGSYNCGPTNSSLVFNDTAGAGIYSTGSFPLTLSATTITFDFRFYAQPYNGTTSWIIARVEQASGYGIRISTTDTTLTVRVRTSSASYTITYPTPFYQWKRYTVSVDTAANIAKFYLDGVEVGSVAVAAGSFATTAFEIWLRDFISSSYTSGYMQNISLFNQYKNSNSIQALGNSYFGTTGTYSGGLVYNWRLNGTLAASIGAVNLVADNVGAETYSTTEYAPIKFGASFVAVQYPVTLTYKTSLQYPNDIPDDCTGMLVVRWVDDEGDVQRRKLWDLDGVDIAPAPVLYNGEVLNETFVLEFWNIDGEATLEIPEDIIIRLSKTTDPTTSYDSTAVAAATITADSTIAEPFELTPFPLTFETQQTY